MSRHIAAKLAVVGVLALTQTAVGAQNGHDNGPALEGIAIRDQLIADQETLLNTYRCRFDIDTHIVPGGCAGGNPSLGPAPPGTFEDAPTPADMAVRDRLIADQETLLNTYRCRFDIDTHIVPGACPGFRFDSGEPPSQIAEPSTHTAVSAGGNHVCLLRGLRSDRAIQCWGDNGVGQTDSPSGAYTAIAAGHSHTCAIAADQSIACWGSSEYGQADPPGGGGQWTAVAAGDAHSCGLRADGAVGCWGNNELGQSDPPEESRYTAISAGWGHTCGLRADGAVDCWGNNGHRQRQAPPGAFTAVVAGDVHSCGLRAEGAVDCWGFFGFYGRPVYAPATTFTDIAAGDSFSCGLLSDDNIFCWGRVSFLVGSRSAGPGLLVEWHSGRGSFFAWK